MNERFLVEYPNYIHKATEFNIRSTPNRGLPICAMLFCAKLIGCKLKQEELKGRNAPNCRAA